MTTGVVVMNEKAIAIAGHTGDWLGARCGVGGPVLDVIPLFSTKPIAVVVCGQPGFRGVPWRRILARFCECLPTQLDQLEPLELAGQFEAFLEEDSNRVGGYADRCSSDRYICELTRSLMSDLFVRPTEAAAQRIGIRLGKGAKGKNELLANEVEKTIAKSKYKLREIESRQSKDVTLVRRIAEWNAHIIDREAVAAGGWYSLYSESLRPKVREMAKLLVSEFLIDPGPYWAAGLAAPFTELAFVGFGESGGKPALTSLMVGGWIDNAPKGHRATHCTIIVCGPGFALPPYSPAAIAVLGRSEIVDLYLANTGLDHARQRQDVGLNSCRSATDSSDATLRVLTAPQGAAHQYRIGHALQPYNTTANQCPVDERRLQAISAGIAKAGAAELCGLSQALVELSHVHLRLVAGDCESDSAPVAALLTQEDGFTWLEGREPAFACSNMCPVPA